MAQPATKNAPTASIEEGSKAPSCSLPLTNGETVNLADYKGKKNVVLYFYPKDDTPGCTTENKDFTALSADFAAAGVALLGISKDTPEKHAKFIAKHALTVPLASDSAEGGLSDALGIWTEKLNYGRAYRGMVRTTLLIGADGKIARVWSKVKVKDHAAQVLEAARAL